MAWGSAPFPWPVENKNNSTIHKIMTQVEFMLGNTVVMSGMNSLHFLGENVQIVHVIKVTGWDNIKVTLEYSHLMISFMYLTCCRKNMNLKHV